MHRKGNVHDLAFTNGRGPRLHHLAYWAPSPINIIHLCDVMASTGYLANMERGPGRHGISNAFFLYVRDPDGHRARVLLLRLSDRWIPTTSRCAGRCATRAGRRCGASRRRARGSRKASPFTGQPVREPAFVADVTIAD